MANADVVADVADDRRNGHAQRLLRTPDADLGVGVAIPVGCMVPLAIAAAVLVGAGVFLGTPHVLVRS